MRMKTFALFASALLTLACLSHAFVLNDTREEMLSYYQTKLEPKVPKSARMLMGDEKVNVHIGGRTLGIEIRNGELYSFETYQVQGAGIDITVSDSAADAIRQGKSGVLAQLEKGEIKITTTNFLSTLKIETAKRIYAVSGADDQIIGKKKSPPADSGTYNSIYVQRAKIANRFYD